MNSLSIYKTIELTFELNGYLGYYFGKDKNLYNAKTGRQLKHTINGGCKGWWINKKFLSHNKLKPLLQKPKKEILPF